MKVIGIITRTSLVFALIISTIIYGTLYTELGLNAVYRASKNIFATNLKISGLKGTIADGISFKNLDYYDDTTNISISKFKSNWEIKLLSSELILKSFEAENVALLLPEDNKSLNKSNADSNSTVKIPLIWFKILVENFQIKYLSIRKSNSAPAIAQDINLKFILNKYELMIDKVAALYNRYKITGNGLINVKDFPDIFLEINAVNNTSHQSYSAIIKTQNHKITGSIKASPKNSIDLKFAIEMNNSVLQLNSNWMDGNLFYSNKDYNITKGELQLSSKILLSNNILDNNIEYLFSYIEKTPSIDKGAILNDVNFSLKYGELTISSKNNIKVSSSIFDISGKSNILMKNTISPINIKAEYIANRSPKEISIEKLSIIDMQNHIKASGKLSNRSNFTYSINIDDFSKYLKNIKGKILSSGSLQGDLQDPNLEIKAQVNDLKLFNMQNDFLDLKLKIGKNHSKDSGNINMINFIYDDIIIDKANMSLHNINNMNVIKLLAEAYGYKISTKLNYKKTLNEYIFSIQQITIIDPLQNYWKNNNYSTITINPDNIAMSDICLINSRNRICSNFEYKNKKNFSIYADVLVNTDLLNYYINPIDIDSQIKLKIDYRAKDNRLIKTILNLQSNNIAFVNNSIGQRKNIKEISIATSSDNNNINLRAKMTKDNNNYLDLNLDYNNTRLDNYALNNAKVSGYFETKYNNFELIDVITSSIDKIRGNIYSKILLSGHINKPKLNGAFKLTDGHFTVVPSGTEIKEINTNLQIKDNYLEGTASAKSGKGKMNISTHLSLDNSTINNLNFDLKAKNFRVFDTSKIIIDIDSNLQLSNSNFYSLKGNVSIIDGNITIDDFPNVESISKDIIIDQVHKDEKSPIFYDLDVNINKKVKLSAYSIKGNLTGTLRFVNNEIFSDAVFGNVRIINGKYKFFSNKLTIEQGELSYAGAAIDDPNIDVRASTPIFSNSYSFEEKIPKLVGIKASGKIYDPEITLFSEPASFSQVDILSYLALGKSSRQISNNRLSSITSAYILLQGTNNDLGVQNKLQRALPFDQIDINTEYSDIPITEDELRDNSQAQVTQRTNLVLGKQLTPKINISINFSKGANDVQQILKASYALTKKWKVSVESKRELDSAVRLIYNIEFW